MNKLFALLSLVALAGCAQQPVQYYPAPAPTQRTVVVPPPPVSSETVISATSKIVGKTRDNLLRSVSAALPGSHFSITNVDYKSGVMQLRYAGDPRNFVDCGKVNSTVKLPTGDKTFEFPAARAYQQYQIMSRDKVFNVDRRMNLEAQIQLSMQPVDAARTSAQLQTRYGLTRDQFVTPVAGGTPFNSSDSVSFMHNESATFPNAGTRCAPTMQLEAELMQIIR